VRAQLKVVLLVAVVLVATLSAVVWKTQGLLLEDKLRFINDSSLKQIAPLKRLVSEKIEGGKNDLVRFATTREAQGAGHSSAFGFFDVVALLEPTPPSQTAQWAPTWIEKGPNARADKWPAGYDVTLLKSLPYAKVKDGQSLWVRLSDSQGAPLYAVLVSVEVQAAQPSAAPTPAPVTGAALPENPTSTSATPRPTADETFETPAAPASSGPRRAVVVGMTTENPLASVTEDYIGSINTVFILDERGYVASHIDKAYLGSLFSEDSIAKEVMKGQKLSDTGEYEDMEGRKVIGHFERVENTNLTVVITTPIEAATAVVDQSLRNTILVGGSVGFLGLILAWLVGSSLGGPVLVQPLKDRADTMTDLGDVSNPKPAAEEVVAPVIAPAPQVDVGNERLKEERKYAYQAFHSTLAARLREPLLAVLGHVQLVKTKTTDEAVLAHADSIEREARLAKDSIEHWQILEEAPTLQDASEKVDLEKVALSALADKSIELEGSGVEVVRDTTAVPIVRGRAKELESALGNMIENAIEAMRDRPRRKLTVKLTMVGNTIRLSLEDTGIGMSRDVREKAFEPFFKGFEAPRHMGLGLAFVQNALKRSGATADIESTPGEGARFILKFPVDPEAKKAFDAQRAPPVIPKPVVKAEPAPQPPPIVREPVVEPPPVEVAKAPEPKPVPAPEPAVAEEPTRARTVAVEPIAPEPPPAPAVEIPKQRTTMFKLGGKEPLDGDTASSLPPFPGTPASQPLTNATAIETPMPTADLSSALDDEDDDDDKFQSVSINESAHESDNEPVAPTPSPESSGTAWEVKIRRPKPKGQS
jgi:signal transduction histidine kinase